MKKKHKRKIRIDRVIIFLLGVFAVSFLCVFIISKLFKTVANVVSSHTMYVAANTSSVPLYNMEFIEDGSLVRGTEIKISSDKITNADKEYYKVNYNKQDYYILASDLTKNKDEIVKEKELYVRTPITLYQNEKDNLVLIYHIP